MVPTASMTVVAAYAMTAKRMTMLRPTTSASLFLRWFVFMFDLLLLRWRSVGFADGVRRRTRRMLGSRRLSPQLSLPARGTIMCRHLRSDEATDGRTLPKGGLEVLKKPQYFPKRFPTTLQQTSGMGHIWSGKPGTSTNSGPFRFIPEERQLLRDNQPVPLTPKSFDLLVVLVENTGHLLEKGELLKRIWPG